jgi:hypothetical protein
MPKRPPLDLDAVARDAHQSTLAALARAEHADEVVAAARPIEPRADFAAGVAILELAVTALDLAVPTGSSPLEYYGLRERYLPEIEFRGRVEHRNSQWAIYAAACLRGGLEPDIGRDTGWWQSPMDLHRLRTDALHPSGCRAPQRHRPRSRPADRATARP